MTDRQATIFVERVKLDMRAALKAQHRNEASVLQALLAKFSNAEAVSVDTATPAMGNGVGSTEVARKNLTFADLQLLVNEELAELQQVIEQLREPSSYKEELLGKAAILQQYIQ